MEYQLIETDESLANLVQRALDDDAVIVDTEFMRHNTYYPQAALFQLCFSADPQTAWLIDPLAVEEFAPLCRLLEHKDTVKVIHSASEDLEVFQTLLGCQPGPLFDTQRAAAFCGLGFGLGYRRLIESTTGLELAKDETRSDWLQRPLSTAQLEYAAADVVPLLPVYYQLRDQLVEKGCLDWVLEDGAYATSAASAPPSPSYVRVKSAWKLPPPQLAVLHAVCEWRDTRARELDKPRSWILSDKLCLALAQQCPHSMQQLKSIQDMPPAVVRRQGERLLDIIDEALEMDAAELPPSLNGPLNAGQRDQLKRVKQAAAEMAQQWQVEPEVLLPSKEYELMVRLGDGEAVTTPPSWSGWRREQLIEPLLKVLKEG
jgi:ribonuclease D